MIQIKRITRPIDLSEYDPAYADAHLHVWVNLTRDMIERFGAAKLDNGLLYAWYAELLSQHSDQLTHVTPMQFGEMYDADPLLGGFVVRRALELITAHREDVEKKSLTRGSGATIEIHHSTTS